MHAVLTTYSFYFQFSAAEVNNLREQLKKIESNMKDGNFVDADGNILAGQDDLKALKDRCWRWTEIVLERYALFIFL